MRLIVLDRDGVINHDDPDHIRSAKAWRPIDGSLEAIARFTHAGWRVVVASNQSGIGRGLFGYGELFAIHDKMLRMAAELGGRIDGVFFCPHAPDTGCACRKPEPGLYRQIAERLGTDLKDVPAVGDAWRDLQAARAGGAIPVLVRTGNGRDTEARYRGELADVAIHDDLAAAAVAILDG